MPEFFNLPTEKFCLAAILKDPKQYLPDTTADFFSTENDQTLYKLLRKFFYRFNGPMTGKFIDKFCAAKGLTVEVQYQLQERFEELTQMVIENVGEVLFGFSQLKEMAIKRKLYDAAVKTSTALMDDQNPLTVFHELVGALPYELTTQKNVVAVGENAEEMWHIYQERKLQGRKFIGVPTGVDQLDSLTDGFQPGELVVIVGRPNVGKSTVALNFACNAAKAGKKVLFISIEMPKTQVFRRINSMLFGIPYEWLKKGTLPQAVEDKYQIALNELKLQNLPLVVCDAEGSFSTTEAFGEVRKFKQRYGGLDMVVIDYLGMMRTDAKTERRHETIGIMCLELRAMARKEQTVVLIPHQLSREAAKAHVLGLEHIAEADMIGRTADTVIALEPQVDVESKMRLNILKYRDGAKKFVDVFIDWEKLQLLGQ